MGKGMEKGIVLITACGKKKEKFPTIAGKLYKSSRIRHLHKISRRLGIPFYILSAKYGLVHSEEIIQTYDEILTWDKCKALKEQIENIISNFDIIIFYKGGSRKEYYECIKNICNSQGKKLISFGFGNMGDIGKLEEIIREADCEA